MKEIVRKRFMALFIDWLCICGYLAVLAIVMISAYYIIWGTIPQFTEIQSQLIATFTSVIPINVVSILLVIMYVVQVIFSKSHRHIGDIVADAAVTG